MQTDSPSRPRLTWLRMDKEPANAYEAARVYFEMGASRSLEQCRQIVGEVSVRTLERWSSRWYWPARARAWDERRTALEEQARLKAEQARARNVVEQRMRAEDEELALADALRNKAMAILRLPLASAETVEEVKTDPETGIKVKYVTTIIKPNFSFVDAARLIDIASKLGRRALGMDRPRGANDPAAPTWLPPPVPPPTADATFDFDSLSTEELEAVIRILEKAKRPDVDLTPHGL